ncbi:MAG: DUF1848 domain-containing protein [Chloroflexales bacterium]
MESINPRIISVSRRTDIPAYYADWLRQRMERGFTAYPNPHSGKPVFIDLRPESVRCFVFWTRNPHPLFKHLDYIDARYQRRHYMHITINGLPETLEARNPKIDVALRSVAHLADRYGPDYVQWRFDPIIISSETPVELVVERFADLSRRLAGMTRRCYFSFVDLYQKTRRNVATLERQGIRFDLRYSSGQGDLALQSALAATLRDVAAPHGITLHACAEDQVQLLVPGIEKAHCVDAELVERVARAGGMTAQWRPSRTDCGCIDSRDIGHYDSCPHGCIYCYANMNPETALANARQYAQSGFPADQLEQPDAPAQAQTRLDLW